MIARIGGSTADTELETGSNALRIGFAVGRMCVYGVPSSAAGALFLGVNDHVKLMSQLEGSLLVNVFEAL